MGTESVTFSNREFHASASTLEVWLRLLTLNIHYPDPSLKELQIEWLDASHDLEIWSITLDGYEKHFPALLKATDRLLTALDKCGDRVPHEFLNLLGFTSFVALEGGSLGGIELVRAGRAFRALLMGDATLTMEIDNGEQVGAGNPLDAQ